MAWSSACQTFSQNLFLGGKNKLAGAAFIKSNNISAVSDAPIPAPAIALSISSAPSSVVKYLEDDFQKILRTVLDFRPLVILPALA